MEVRITQSALFTSLMCGLWMAIGTILNTNGLEQYGNATFLLTPFVVGILAAVVTNWHVKTTMKKTLMVGFISLLISYTLLIIFAFEGMWCIIMTLPLGFLMQWIGSVIGHAVVTRIRKPRQLAISLLILHPLFSFIEPHLPQSPDVKTPSYSLIVYAPKEQVWELITHKIAFNEPSNLFLKFGVSYPISTEFIETEKRQYLKCDYSNGSAKLWIDSLNAQDILRFTLSETPAPMKELSFYKEVHAPHLHGNFEVFYGEFKLTTIDEHSTKITATTSYRHHIKPGIYWQQWSDYLINKVHALVLNQIKENLEK